MVTEEFTTQTRQLHISLGLAEGHLPLTFLLNPKQVVGTRAKVKSSYLHVPHLVKK